MKRLFVVISICAVAITVLADTNAGNDQQKGKSDDGTINEANADAGPQWSHTRTVSHLGAGLGGMKRSTVA